MKNLLLLLLFHCMASVALAGVSTRVYLADGNTPLELADPNIAYVYRDIMVGTKLSIIVDSNVPGYWDGGLFISKAETDYGILSGRDFNDVTSNWEGSCFKAASNLALVCDWLDDIRIGFDLYTHTSATAGEWFIIDYIATGVGTCNVGFYDYSGPGGYDVPLYELTFSHVHTRDFNNDTKVDFADFAVFASQWQKTGCSDPNWCEGTDLNHDGNVDRNDLVLFADYWLEKTE